VRQALAALELLEVSAELEPFAAALRNNSSSAPVCSASVESEYAVPESLERILNKFKSIAMITIGKAIPFSSGM
jgi:hypothetical protein